MRHALLPEDFQENRRNESRQTCQRPIDLLPYAPRREWKFIGAELCDCSLHGIGVLVQHPMDPGHQFVVKLEVSGDARLLLYTVQNCTQWSSSSYRIGARLIGLADAAAPVDLDGVLNAIVGGA